MVKVECDGCGAPYQIDEKRVPATGLKMRCPKCGKNLLVTKPGDAELPAVPDASRQGLPRVGFSPSAPGKPPPRPPPPPRPAQKSAPEADLPVATGGRTSAMPSSGSGFGEIDLGVDLPSLGSEPSPMAFSAADLPAVRPPVGPPGAPPPRPPAISEAFSLGETPKPPLEAFGELDLPAVSPGGSDLPSPAFGHTELPSSTFGEVDLPEASPGFAGLPVPVEDRAGLPATAARPVGQPPPIPQRRPNRTVNFGDIDLPIAPPAPAATPPPPPGRPSRGRTVNFGDIDLPSLPDDAGGAFGELDLPLAFDGAALPSLADSASLPLVSDASLPSPYGGGLPSPAAHGLPVVAGTGLPMTAQGAGLPLPAQGAGLPLAAQGAGLPLAAQGAGLPLAAQGAGLPLAAQGAGLPLAAGAGLPSAQGAGLPSAQGAGLPLTSHGGLPSALEAGLPMSTFGDGLPAVGQAGLPTRSNAFDDSDRAVPAQHDGSALHGTGIETDPLARPPVGSEADLSATPELDSQAPPAPRDSTTLQEAPVKKSKAARIGVLVGVLAAITGGALTLVPSVGPFGAHFIVDRLNAKANAAALDDVKKAAATQLDEDTYGAVSEAVAHCRSARTAIPRYQPAAAYCALLTLERDVRFGKSPEDEAFAKQLLADAVDDGGPSAVAANATLDLLAGQPAKARPPLADLAQKSPDDVEYGVLSASVELADRAAAKEAVGAWKRLSTSHPSARTLFGLARAQAAADDAKGAEASARAALAASKSHAGARILIATLITTGMSGDPIVGVDPEKEKEALSLLAEVTDKSATGAAASDAEKVAAFAQVGTIHLSRSRMSAAEQAFAAALKIHPLAIAALIGNGELFYRSGRYSEAQSRFEAASNADPESIVPKVGIAKTFIALERMKEAKDLLKKLNESRKGEPLVSLWLGRAEEVLGNKKDAEANYLEAIKSGGNRPPTVDAYVALVRLLSSVGRTDEANTRLAEAAKRFPDLPALHRARGELALQLGRFEEARSELDAALRQVDDLGTRFHLGVTLRRMRRYTDAGAEFDKVGAVDADYPGLALERGVISQETGQTERALELYRQALAKAPDDVDLKLRVGQTQVLAGHPLEAEKILEEVRRARPRSAEANHYLGRVLLAKGENLAEAARYLEVAAQVDGNRPEYLLYVGWVANEQGQAAKAAPALNKAIELDHDLGDAYWQRGVLLEKQGATTDALRDLRTALEKNPSRFEAWATIALCDQDLQKYDEAEKAWQAAIAGNGDVAEWHYRLGKLMREHGNRASLAAEMEKAVTLGERPGQTHNAWLYDAHLLLAEALRGSLADRPRAIEHYKRFLALAPASNPYRKEAEEALRGLGAPVSQ